MASEKVMQCCGALIEKKRTISFAESASAGKMSYEFSTVIDSGKILIGGLVCYHSSMKEDLLSIPTEIIEKYSAESAEVTQLMAQNLKRLVQADIYVALTGLSTPGGSESPAKPVGTIFLHILFPDKEIANKYLFKGNPEEIILQAIDQAADLIWRETEG